jgi:uncharacterized protein (TIGR02680 family)
VNDTVTVLPVATTERWSPTRAGLVNVWRYWDETFTFHRGRLLLRGPNGSGKSMALELLLPFLLDADATPARLTSAAKSRGGLYERIMTGSTDPSRAGFAWVEFRRGPEVFTVGVRLRASAATRKVDHDFFTCSLAVGHDLHLLDGQRSPLSRRGLVEALGERGQVHASAEEHRSAVREVLFPGFGPDRFASVIGALLALRKEKLSQNLDLDKLSDVLSEALPPLDEHELAAVAEGFERLDRRRAELGALERELDEVKTLAAAQRSYTRAVVGRVSGEVRSAETRRDDVTRAEREAGEALAAAAAEAEAMEAEIAGIASRLADLDVEVTALKDSEAYREGANLDDLRAEAGRLKGFVEQAGRRAHRAAELRDQRADELDAAATERATTASNLDLARDDLRACAARAAAGAVADEATAADPDEGEHLVRAWAGARRAQVTQVREAIVTHGAAVQHRGFTEARLADDQRLVDERLVTHRAAEDALAAATDDYTRDVRAWAQTCATVGATRVADALPATLDDPAATTEAVARLVAEVRTEHAVARRDIAATRRDVEAERARLVAERDELAEGHRVEPVPPAWRTGRDGRAGAPLWRLVDLRPGVAADQLDGVEAAVAASGLIDAWVSPEGTLDLPAGVADLLLGPRPVAGRTLADVLVPLDDAPVRHDVVDAVLASIPVADHVDAAGADVLVALDGTFRLGPAVGRAPAAPARLLGTEAQERHRLARIAALGEAIAALDIRLAELEADARAVDTREAGVLAELDALPDGRPVTEARAERERAETLLADAERRRDLSRRRLAEAEDAVRQELRRLTTTAARRELPTTAAGLDEVVNRVDDLQQATETWARRARDLAGAERGHRRATDEAERAATEAGEAAEHLADVERQAADVAVRLAALESTVGAEYQDVLDRLLELGDERRRKQARGNELTARQPGLHQRIGGLETQLGEARHRRTVADEQRAAAHRRFVALVGEGLSVEAGVEMPDRLDGVTAVREAARATAAALERVASDEQAVDRASARVEERLHYARGALSGLVDLDRELTEHGWWALRTAAGGIRRSASDLTHHLARELDEGRAELAADEERLFERTLAGSVRQALADRIRLANRLVEGINRQLDEVRTAAGGVQVRLRWDVDPDQPDAVRSARTLLLRDPADLSDSERASLQDFVRARIDQARAELEVNAPWEARLRETLDYRAWHHFTLQLAHRDWDGFQPATPRRLQRLSTGERSIALHLPMLASIAAHYADDDGRPASCPRLILLDELFAGVDSANRAQLFGTFTAWQLDAVFTSDHEWCQYATLDGIAIHHLHPAVGDEPVTSTRFTWDGRRRTIDPPAA